MSDRSQQTEKPTQRKLQKTREEGNFPTSRQFVAAVQFGAFVAALSWWSGGWFRGMRLLFARLLDRAASGVVTPAALVEIFIEILQQCLLPLLGGGAFVIVVTLAAQLAVTGLGVSAKKLMPDFQRLNPMSRLREMPRQNLSALLQATILLPLFGYAVFAIARDHMDEYWSLPMKSVEAGFAQVAESFGGLLWRAAGLFFVFGIIELLRERGRFTRNLMMSKQDIRDEMKETEGSPQIKMRIRRMQRDLRRRQMMKNVPTATAVVTNPTHYAIALRYDMETSGAPMVVAKGKNYMAQRIKQKAKFHQIPIIENPPLAQALYKSADVGQEIPAHLYRAVAEVLAYVYRIMHGLPG